jgi:coenzyme F420 hydrogenase subunit beta
MQSIKQVLSNDLCSGCGLCTDQNDKMIMDAKGFLRPEATNQHFNIEHCPGYLVQHFNHEAEYDLKWGPILNLFEGFSTDEGIRRAGSSGGVLSGILIKLLKDKTVDKVIQVGVSETDPIKNITKIIDNPDDILINAGSRYSPSSPLDIISTLIHDNFTYAIVAKPCDIAALRSFMNEKKEYKKKFKYLLSFMCAGVPSEEGTNDILKKLDIKKEDLIKFRYRGDGWPGLTVAETKSGDKSSMSYNDSWGNILNKHLQKRCKLCADGTGEAADLVCADAWHESDNGYPSFEEAEGKSLIIVRTRAGENLFNAMKDDVEYSDYDIDNLDKIQPYQMKRKMSMAARLFALKTLRLDTPKYKGHNLFLLSLNYPFKTLVRTYFATLRRIIQKKL